MLLRNGESIGIIGESDGFTVSCVSDQFSSDFPITIGEDDRDLLGECDDDREDCCEDDGECDRLKLASDSDDPITILRSDEDDREDGGDCELLNESSCEPWLRLMLSLLSQSLCLVRLVEVAWSEDCCDSDLSGEGDRECDGDLSGDGVFDREYGGGDGDRLGLSLHVSSVGMSSSDPASKPFKSSPILAVFARAA